MILKFRAEIWPLRMPHNRRSPIPSRFLVSDSPVESNSSEFLEIPEGGNPGRSHSPPDHIQLFKIGQPGYTKSMTTDFERIREEVKRLSTKEKAALAHELVGELDEATDENVERLWLEEAEQRYEAYKAGNHPAIDGDEAMQNARNRLA
jgi:putative addiction module component (TIGR02574 family)